VQLKLVPQNSTMNRNEPKTFSHPACLPPTEQPKRPPRVAKVCPFVSKAIVVTQTPRQAKGGTGHHWAFLVLRASADNRFDLPGGKTENIDLVDGYESPEHPGFWRTLSRTLVREISEEIPALDVRDLVVIHREFRKCVTRSVKKGHAYFVLFCPHHRLLPAIATTAPLSREHIWGALVGPANFLKTLAEIFAGNDGLREWVKAFWVTGRKKLSRHFAFQLPCSGSKIPISVAPQCAPEFAQEVKEQAYDPPLNALAFPFRPGIPQRQEDGKPNDPKEFPLENSPLQWDEPLAPTLPFARRAKKGLPLRSDHDFGSAFSAPHFSRQTTQLLHLLNGGPRGSAKFAEFAEFEASNSHATMRSKQEMMRLDPAISAIQ
jgi:hypothetical protein